MKIFVTHYTLLTDRKNHILRQLNRFHLDSEFIVGYDKESLTEDDLKIFNINKLSLAEISLTMKHIEAYKQVFKYHDYALILEDDVILSKDFDKQLDKYIQQLPNDWDMLFIGDGCYLHVPQDIIQNGVNVYRAPSSRCADSYLISKKCTKQILNDIYKNNFIIEKPIDHLLNHFIDKFDLKNFWAEPTITTQGTQVGLFKTSINERGRL